DSVASTGTTQPADFESQMQLMWLYARERGSVPGVDIWYPYTGFFYLLRPWAPDSIYCYLHQLGLAAIFVLSVFVLLDRSKAWTLICFALLVLGTVIGLYTKLPRYLLSIDLVLWAAAAQRSRGRTLVYGHALFTVYALFLEPTQCVYAAPA